MPALRLRIRPPLRGARRASIACAEHLAASLPPPDDASDPTPPSSPSLHADCLPHHGGKWADERSNASLFPPSAHAALAPCYAPAPPSTPPMPVSFPTFPTGLRPVHRGRRLRRQHGVLQNSHLDGRPRLRYVCLFDGRLERLDCRRPCMQVLTTAPSSPQVRASLSWSSRAPPQGATRATE